MSIGYYCTPNFSTTVFLFFCFFFLYSTPSYSFVLSLTHSTHTLSFASLSLSLFHTLLTVSFSHLKFFFFFLVPFIFKKDIFFWSIFLLENLEHSFQSLARTQTIALLTNGELFYIYLLLRSSRSLTPKNITFP